MTIESLPGGLRDYSHTAAMQDEATKDQNIKI
jgi:hypothetical protein